ncbi:MAG: DUF5715 family protein [Patescibacteria group bacterium]
MNHIIKRPRLSLWDKVKAATRWCLVPPIPEEVLVREADYRRGLDNFGPIYGRWLALRAVVEAEIEAFLSAIYVRRQYQPVRHVLFARERRLFVVLIGTVVLIFAANANAEKRLLPQFSVSIDELSASVTDFLIKPDNWLSGPASLTGSRASVLGAFHYAKEARYAFAANNAERDRLVANGTLVKLEGPYLELIDVSSPYVLPVVAKSTNRLGQQYAEQGCGKLKVSSGMRPLDFQKTIKHGSSLSVHPTGMAVDLRRIVPENKEQITCLNWLAKTLQAIEADGRVDATAETRPERHFHVVAVPHVYEAWLATLPPQLDPDVKWLATTLHFEAAPNELTEGYRAIAWVIRNRVRSSEFPNTTIEVVAEGAAGLSTGGCQFSFMCDGKQEDIYEPCKTPNPLMTRYWLNKCAERWEVVVNIAKQVLAEPETNDPTGGAVLYYAASMPKAPAWSMRRVETRRREDGSKYQIALANGDLKTGTIKQIGSHIFGCSIFRGKDACRS